MVVNELFNSVMVKVVLIKTIILRSCRYDKNSYLSIKELLGNFMKANG